MSDDDIILHQINQESNSNQSELLTILLQDSLEKSNLNYQDLDLVTFTNGPASFTAVRIGYIAARMINLCCKTPIFAISTNMAIAIDYLDSSYQKIITVIDARLGDVFFQIFDLNNGELLENSEILMVKIEEIEKYLPKDNNFLLVGSGKELVKKHLNHREINIGNKEDIIKAKNISKIALKYYKKNNKIPDEPIYIRKPRIG